MPIDSTWLQALEYRCIGPHRGGRVVAVAGHPTDSMTFYHGACAGGVWKTTDGGVTWTCISDGFLKTSAVGAMAVAESDPNVIYVGMGETTIRGNVSHGDGVYKSTDGGKTWTNVGLKDTRHIAKIRVHPRNPDLVYVAALGHAWGPNAERGVYRSADGGRSWERVLFRSERAGAVDLTMDPTNPRILYAAIWQAQRYPHQLVSGGPDSSLYKTVDGGDTWTEITRNQGLPQGVLGKIGVAVSPAKPDRVWALVEAEDGALFRSDDGGATWQRLSEHDGLRRRAWYYMHIFADPQDAETVWVLNLSCWKSIDGGKTFTEVGTPHGDHHDQWLDPRNPQRMIQGNDGGACVTFNGGQSWSTLYNQPTAQFYHAYADNAFPYNVYGSQQDNTALRLPSSSMLGAITSGEWLEPGGGESGYIAVKPSDPHIIIGGAIGSGFGNGRLIHFDARTRQERAINVWPEVTAMGVGAIDLKYRFQWTFPVFYSRWDPEALFIAGNHVFRSRDDGLSWEVVSPDLTRNNPSKLERSGGPITADNTGAEVYCTIFALAESSHEQGVLWAGTDDGLVHLSRDGGQTWQNVTPPDLPEWALISVVEPSPHDPATAYVAATRYKHDDTRPYLYKTGDYGQTWQRITHGIPHDDFTRVIREDPACRGLLYAGTETGLYVSFDDGANWQPLQLNLPVCPIHDLIIKDNDLVVATHGRSFWILDDVTPLHALKAGVAQGDVYLYPPRPTYRIRINKGYGHKPVGALNYRMAGPVVYTYTLVDRGNGEKAERPLDAGQNPPDGVIIGYYLKDQPEGDISLTVLDASGQTVRQFSSAETPAIKSADGLTTLKKDPRLAKQAGANRFIWNLRLADAVKLPGDKATEELGVGPLVPPGRYTLRLQAGEQTVEQPLDILIDPRVPASQADLEEQYNLLKRVGDKLSETHKTILQVRDLRDQAEGLAKRLRGRPGAESMVGTADALKDKLTAIEAELAQVKSLDPRALPSKLNFRLAALMSIIDGAESRPARQTYEVFDELAGRVDRQLSQLEALLEQDVAVFNAMARDAGIEALILTA